MKCVMCGEGTVASRVEVRRYDIGLDSPIIIDQAEVRRCDHCGDEGVVLKHLDKMLECMAGYIAQKNGGLTPKEIRFLRTQLGYSGEDMAKYMGVEIDTLRRWERGDQPMGEVSERLLRTYTLTGKPLLDYSVEGEKKPVKARVSMRGDSWQVAAV
jgi:putative zinc finger/helix-turn-helix YgiT family protein